MLPKINGLMRINSKEMKYATSGTAILKLNCVSSEKHSDKEDTCWIECISFGKQAETINQYFNEKDRIYINGKLKQDSWQDNQGQKRSKHTIIIESFDFVENKQQAKQSQGYNHSGNGMNQPANHETYDYNKQLHNMEQPTIDIDYQEIPF